MVAFTPKGGCPLKLVQLAALDKLCQRSSIHPQGWVPIETKTSTVPVERTYRTCSIHPQGWVPIETTHAYTQHTLTHTVAFTPKGGCPLKPNLIIVITDGYTDW